MNFPFRIAFLVSHRFCIVAFSFSFVLRFLLISSLTSLLTPSFFLKDFIYLFLEREEGREKEKERNINMWLLVMRTLLGTWPTTQACGLTGT